jgi:hypothetical protein
MHKIGFVLERTTYGCKKSWIRNYHQQYLAGLVFILH